MASSTHTNPRRGVKKIRSSDMDPNINSGSAVKKIYQHVEIDCPPRWSFFRDIDKENDHINSVTKRQPIVHRHVFGSRKWVTQDFIVHDRCMRILLRSALAEYPDLDLDEWTFQPPFKPIVHRWDALQDKCAEVQGEKAQGAAEQLLGFLGPILTTSLRLLERTRESGKVSWADAWHIFPPGDLVVTTFFRAETMARALKYETSTLTDSESGKTHTVLLIHVEYVDWNGSRCGYATTKVAIRRFGGLKEVTSLPVYPLAFHEKPDELRTKLLERGRRFEALRGYHFRSYNGTKILLDTPEPEERTMSGRVIVDEFAYCVSRNIAKTGLRGLKANPSRDKTLSFVDFDSTSGSESDSDRVSTTSSSSSSGDEIVIDGPAEDGAQPAFFTVGGAHRQAPPPPSSSRPGRARHPGMAMPTGYQGMATPQSGHQGMAPPPPGLGGRGRGGPPPPPPGWQGGRPGNMPPGRGMGMPPAQKDVTDGPAMQVARSRKPETERREDLTALTEEECLLTTPWMKGFDLKTKEWGRFHVDRLSEVAWNNEAFDRLVLPGNEKELAWQFVENQGLASHDFDDFIPDKGRGIIILMFGPPGVGKTFTAEAVAERSCVPLYQLSAGTLGTRADAVAAELNRALVLCKLWNAMLLLDEADVFLGARTTSDLARNELVAVFLTRLEYYPGICFLTTNRVGALDHAFQSRVDLFLPYADLTVEARRRVWEGFMDKAGRARFAVNTEEVDRLAEVQLNGREIKNLIKSAHLLSLKTGGMIDYRRLSMLAENRVVALEKLGRQAT